MHQIKAMFHSTAMIKDYDAAVSRLGELFGLRVLEYSEADSPAIGRRGGMTWIGDGSIELCEPIVEGAPPDRFIQRTGGGMAGVAIWVEDFAATVAHLETNGVGMPVQLRGFGFSRPRDTCGLQFEWSEFTVKEDPRSGAPEPEFLVAPAVHVTHQAFVGVVVDEPVVAAQRFARAFGARVLFEAPEADVGDAHAAVWLGDCVLSLYPLAPSQSRKVWRRDHDQPRVSLLGLRVDNLAEAEAILADRGVRVLRRAPGILVLDPDCTADIEVALVDGLMPGDVREQGGG
jgi:catechol 2,3-dioxygenase-like lactoylglutathione lyase family enzyme